MGLIREPIGVDFTVISKVWTVEEEREFSELIKRQKEMRAKKHLKLGRGMLAAPIFQRVSLPKRELATC